MGLMFGRDLVVVNTMLYTMICTVYTYIHKTIAAQLPLGTSLSPK